MICVSIGFGFFVEFTLDEAKEFIDKRVPVLEASAAELTETASKIKARIKVRIWFLVSCSSRCHFFPMLAFGEYESAHGIGPACPRITLFLTHSACSHSHLFQVVLEGLRELQKLQSLGEAARDTDRDF